MVNCVYKIHKNIHKKVNFPISTSCVKLNFYFDIIALISHSWRHDDHTRLECMKKETHVGCLFRQKYPLVISPILLFSVLNAHVFIHIKTDKYIELVRASGYRCLFYSLPADSSNRTELSVFLNQHYAKYLQIRQYLQIYKPSQ